MNKFCNPKKRIWEIILDNLRFKFFPSKKNPPTKRQISTERKKDEHSGNVR